MAAMAPCEGLEWHFIGQLQRRKVKSVVGRFVLIHSVDSLALAEEVNQRAGAAGLDQAVLVEVNVGREASKAGFAPAAVTAAVREMDRMPHLSVRGLMTIPPPAADPELSRPYFRELGHLSRSIGGLGLTRVRMDELSMGMSNDFEVAVEEGATFVRVGTAIFGARHA
jgi:pyridoxal phosphate enzyme (YggS family)